LANTFCCIIFPNRRLHSFGISEIALIHKSWNAEAIGDMCSSYSATNFNTPFNTPLQSNHGEIHTLFKSSLALIIWDYPDWSLVIHLLSPFFLNIYLIINTPNMLLESPHLPACVHLQSFLSYEFLNFCWFCKCIVWFTSSKGPHTWSMQMFCSSLRNYFLNKILGEFKMPKLITDAFYQIIL